MASYDDYDAPRRQRSTKRSHYEERGDGRGFVESREYLNVQSRDLIPQPRMDSDLSSVEEIRREFPPPGHSGRDIRRARSAGGAYYDDYDDRRSSYGREREYDRDYDRDYERPRAHRRKSSITYFEEEETKKVRMLSKQEQIIAAITGAALAIGGKEIYDRREASQHGQEVHRNVMASAALGAAGALAGYSGTELYNKKKEKGEKKIVHRGTYYSDDEDSAKEKKGNKNFLESALAAAGLGGAIKALSGGGKEKDDKSDTKSRRGSRSRSRGSRDGKGDGSNKIQKAAMASLIAGATEAFRVSKEPGGWKGEKAKRILTAAAGAATIDAAQKSEKAGSKLGLAESVIGGLVGNRVINGSKKNIEEDEKTGRSRSRSRARSKDGGGGGSGLAALATAGLGAFGAKKLYDKHEESKERSRSRRRSPDSQDSRDGSPDRRHRSRSRSIVDGARRRLSRLGIGNGPDDDDGRRDRSRDRSRRRDYDDYNEPKKDSRRHDRRYDSDDDRDHRRGGGRDDSDSDRSRKGGRDRDNSRQRGTVARRRDASRGGSESDLGDSEDDEKRTRKMRGKQIITSGLAAVATIHAAHNVYQSMEKRQKRQKAVKEGLLSPEDAEKLKKRALMQDAASVGIAALGIKGAISELKEARETAAEIHEWKEKKAERHRRRLERLKQLNNGDGDDYGRQRADIWYSAAPPRASRYDEGPRYVDGNPYSALPPTPTGGERR
ncbi:hypothetical protein B0H66DRAFT_57683 [Apodospora peruviana]|uniref:Uncharacterized protein n=1 Tax=Apodospora peruviana TaxID=516989 RepID=A0AAE0MF97_9PEZI|nr:hypothetical protein B0H66DRAFT_57683 [Apodospora peruviana]